MAGKFINTDQKVMLNMSTDNMKSLINNPYYLFSDKKGSLCTYYNLNTTKTTLDEATGGNYSLVGPNSPFRFNKINDAVIYGVTRVDIDFDVTEVGLSAGEISQEAYILPNTWIPYPGDFFTLNQLGEQYVFKVTSVGQNFLDTEATMYKITYVLEYSDNVNIKEIKKQVTKEYNMILTNQGTNFNAILESSVYELISKMEEYTVKLKDYFYMIFYNQKVQSFTFMYHNCMRVYDPYLIEFIIRNNILKGATEYVNVSQQMFLPSTFGIDYDKTIFSCIEEKDINSRVRINHVGNLLLCNQKLSLLYAYPEDYYYMEYAKLATLHYSINIFGDLDLIYNIRNNIKTGNILVDILIKFFNDENITSDDLLMLKNIDYCDNIELFYGIPIAIFCLEQIISNMMSQTYD